LSDLRQRTQEAVGGTPKFFLINLCHDSLANYYKMNFALMQYHKYSLTELENMIPFEREVYIHMLVQYLEEEKQRIESQKRM
jgi:hypothetical protein